MEEFFKDLKNRVEAEARAGLPVDLADHPEASSVSWTSLKPGGTNFKTHRLQMASSHRVEFVSTPGARLFSVVFAVVGLGGLVVGSIIGFAVGGGLLGLGMMAFGGIFLAVGVYMFRSFDRAIVFDLQDGMFWKGKRPNRADSSIETEKEWCRIEDIVGIQLLRERVLTSKSSYDSYEINLVLQDNSRLNVVDHGSMKQSRTDADALGLFLNVPVWGT
ncbi:MAG: hypothetical protein NWR72_17500 [Bacteroidia bacterium]|nr:hypothetical protein [Bacteroidia bacterium]